MTATALKAHAELCDTIAESHPSLFRGRVFCSRCGKTRRVDPAECLHSGWPKCRCGGGTMPIDSPEEEKT